MNKKRELQYLLEDLEKDLSKLLVDMHVGPYEQEMFDEIRLKLGLLRTIQLGQVQVLDSIQYILAELRIGLHEGDRPYIIASKMIDDIQDFLDWQDSWN